MSSGSPISKINLSERELLAVCAAFLSVKGGDPAIDWPKFAGLAGYANAQSARVCFRAVKDKLKKFDGTATNSGAFATSSKAAHVATTPKKRKGTEFMDDDDELMPQMVSKLPGKRGKGVKKEELVEMKLEELSDDGTMVADGSYGI